MLGGTLFHRSPRVVLENQLRGVLASWFSFLASMILVLMSNNIGLLWVAMETTTLASALLVSLRPDAADPCGVVISDDLLCWHRYGPA